VSKPDVKLVVILDDVHLHSTPQYRLEDIALEGAIILTFCQHSIHLPHKKPRGQELSEQQKQSNKEFSSQRVICEHAHAGIKRYDAVSMIYRNRVPDFDDRLLLTATGLWNFYLEAS
jgi:DDE superfamily endonuclease